MMYDTINNCIRTRCGNHYTIMHDVIVSCEDRTLDIGVLPVEFPLHIVTIIL